MKNLMKIAGIASIASAHIACIALGSYKGNMDANGINVEIPFRYLWGANSVTTGIGKSLTTRKNNTIEKIVTGGLIGTAAAPIEYAIGWGIGFASSFAIDKVFY